MVKRLSAQGISIIYISHYLEEVFQIAHRITVIKDGLVTGCYRANEVSNDAIIKAMVGRETSLVYTREAVAVGERCLEVRDFCRGYIIQHISFDLRKGEILGVGGLVGSGRTELLRLLYGVDKKDCGEMFKNGKKIHIKSPLDAIKNGICMLGENRKVDGMFLTRSIAENVCIVRNEQKLFVNDGTDGRDVQSLNAVLNIKMMSPDQEIQNLYGGNQQKALIGRWLLAQCDIIIFDEPTKGVDIGAREDIYKYMIELVRQGKSIIMVSSDMSELLALSDRVMVLREGRLVGLLPKENLDEQKLLELYFGLAKAS
jgi:ribose transport system ATP-binding protein